MDYLPPPLPTPFQADANWNIYAAHIEQYFLAYNITDDNRKRAILLTSLSFGVFSTLWDFYFPDNPATKTYGDICEVLKAHFSHSVYDERSEFYDAKQQEYESVMDSIARLVGLTRKCRFIEHFDNVLRDKFVCGLLKNAVFNKGIQIEPMVSFEEYVLVALEQEVQSNYYFESCKFISFMARIKPLYRIFKAGNTHEKFERRSISDDCSILALFN